MSKIFHLGSIRGDVSVGGLSLGHSKGIRHRELVVGSVSISAALIRYMFLRKKKALIFKGTVELTVFTAPNVGSDLG